MSRTCCFNHALLHPNPAAITLRLVVHSEICNQDVAPYMGACVTLAHWQFL